MKTQQPENNASVKRPAHGSRLLWLGMPLVAMFLIASLVAWKMIAARYDHPAAVRLVIVARDMAFYLQDPATGKLSAQPNPALRLPAGRSVSILFRNEDQGMQHNLVIPALDRQTRLLSAGEQQQLQLEMPISLNESHSTGGPQTIGNYFCSLHSQVMHGQLVID